MKKFPSNKFVYLIVIIGLIISFMPQEVKAEDVAFSHIVAPTNHSTLHGVNTYIMGVATKDVWFVEISTDNGRNWQRVTPRNGSYQEWIYYWSFPESGEHTIVSRAIAKGGAFQPHLEKYQINVDLPEKIAMVQEIIIDDEKVMPIPYEEVDPFLSEISQHFDVIELKFWSHYWGDWTMETAQHIIDRIHHYGMRVAISAWQYPNDNDISPWVYHANKLDTETGQPYDVLQKDQYTYPAIDRTNPSAVQFMADKWKAKLSQLRDVDYIFFNEDKLQTWSTPWPELATPYWDSPTYSEGALENFRWFLSRRIGDSAWIRKFPVEDEKYVNARTELNNDKNYWDYWYEWRDEAFGNWINKMAQWAHLANADNPNFQGCIYMQWQRVFDNRKYGVSIDKIGLTADRNWIAMYVNEHGEDSDPNFNEDKAQYVSNKARAQGKNFAGFVNFYAWAQGRHTVGVIAAQFNTALNNQANMIVSYNAQTFYSKHELFNQIIVNMWDQLRSHIN
ncbi:hypothetical protein KKI23_01260 [Patescibacteria group bacterium]|nr:hypothetical protein [Patescibacteria group bacterium]